MFFCTECGAEATKWSGKCNACGAWNSLKESTAVTGKKTKRKGAEDRTEPVPIGKIKSDSTKKKKTGISEFDCVLGGGIVPGMCILIGGEPGIGKSTLMLQIAEKIASCGKVLYVSGEESKEQIKLRADRLNCKSDELMLLCSTDVENIIQNIAMQEPDLVIIDSIQSVYSTSMDNAPGSVSQLRECTAQFTRVAKKTNIPIFLIGHVTKDGFVAGPKIIEHIVDTVLYFEGDNKNSFKILRTTKNRFGSTNEIGLFEMVSTGLKEVTNPSELFLSNDELTPGTSIGCMLEGTRAFLVEVQALVSPASFGVSQRVAVGFDHKRLAMLLAVIEKNFSLNLKQNDVFINVTGGIKLTEPALDLAIISAVISGFNEFEIPQGTVFIGEIGLNGEIRPVSQMGKRIKEAEKLGFNKIIVSDRVKLNNKNVKKIKHIKQVFSVIR